MIGKGYSGSKRKKRFASEETKGSFKGGMVMIEPSSFLSGFAAAIVSFVVALYLFFKRYRKVVLSINLDKLKETGYYLIESLKDAKLSEEEKLAILNKLRDAITEETRVVRINADEVKEVKPDEIISAIKTLYPAVQIKAVSDGKYYTVSEAKWREIVENDFVERKKYLVSRFDCEDYSRSFVARIIENYGLNACGIVWGWMTEGEYHAWNFIYTSEGRLLWFEAQSNELFVPSAEKYKYEAIYIFM